MKQTLIILSLMLACLFVIVSYSSHAANLAKATILVVDEEGMPLKDAEAFFLYTGALGKDTSSSGKTNKDGRYTDTMLNTFGEFYGYGAEKEGYYRTEQRYTFKELGLKHWKPWNPELRVVLRKIVNPVEMYARDLKKGKGVELPIVGEEVGFDLIACDWVEPYGNGTHTDIYFKVERLFYESRKKFEAKLFVRFPDTFSGIQPYYEDISYKKGSVYHLPRIAPEDGYNSAIEFYEKVEPPNSYGGGLRITRKPDFIAKDINYIFRIRTIVKEGKLAEAMYGKIHGPIDFGIPWSPTAKIYMRYYLNPDHTRNLEFDPKQNLFRNLSGLEQVGIH